MPLLSLSPNPHAGASKRRRNSLNIYFRLTLRTANRDEQTRPLQRRRSHVSPQSLSTSEQLQRLPVLRTDARSRFEPRIRLPRRSGGGTSMPHLPPTTSGRGRHTLLPHILQDLSEQPPEAISKLPHGQKDGAFKGRAAF